MGERHATVRPARPKQKDAEDVHVVHLVRTVLLFAAPQTATVAAEADAEARLLAHRAARLFLHARAVAGIDAVHHVVFVRAHGPARDFHVDRRRPRAVAVVLRVLANVQAVDVQFREGRFA